MGTEWQDNYKQDNESTQSHNFCYWELLFIGLNSAAFKVTGNIYFFDIANI